MQANSRSVPRILYYDVIDSTNDEAKRLVSCGLNDLTALIAKFQSNGRGQFENRWLSKAGDNVLLSVVCGTNAIPSQLPLFTYTVAEAIQNILTAYGIRSTIKKPNDLLVEGEKIAGILVESITVGTKTKALIIGLGLNVNATRQGLPSGATSMRLLTKKTFETESIAKECIAAIIEVVK